MMGRRRPRVLSAAESGETTTSSDGPCAHTQVVSNFDSACQPPAMTKTFPSKRRGAYLFSLVYMSVILECGKAWSVPRSKQYRVSSNAALARTKKLDICCAVCFGGGGQFHSSNIHTASTALFTSHSDTNLNGDINGVSSTSKVPSSLSMRPTSEFSVSVSSSSTNGGILPPSSIRPRYSPTPLQRLSSGFQRSLEQLRVDPSKFTALQVERWSVLVAESMSAPSRNFHRLQHVFELESELSDPVQILAVYFHDVVYFSVDGGLSREQQELLKDVVDIQPGGSIELSSMGECLADPSVAMVVSVFGFECGQVINPFRGLNEFLSAVIAVQCLKGVLSMEELVKVVACIEATIPFRPKDECGRSAADALYGQLLTTRSDFEEELGKMTDADIARTVQMAVEVANVDVGNFAGDPSAFLANTWTLLTESNLSLRHTTQYRISDYNLALTKMGGFFSFLDPGVIFGQFRGYPADIDHQRLTIKARQNLEIAKKYMNSKILAVSLVGALAEQTGGDAPMSHFMGEVYDPKEISPRVEDFIEVNFPERDDGTVTVHPTVFAILRDGRTGDCDFDMRNSPLAAYVYGMVGDEGLERLMSCAACPMDTTSAKILLGSLPNEVVRQVARACSNIALTRSNELRKLANTFEETDVF